MAWMEELRADVRLAVRSLRKAPGFTLLVVLILGLGIGGSTLVYGWIHGVLLNPLAGIPDAGRLVAVETVMPDGGYHTTSYLDYRDYRDQDASFSGLAAAALVAAEVGRPKQPRPEQAWGMIVSENYFQVLGVRAARGRVFEAGDARGPGSDPDIILSYGWWQRRFGGAAGVVGSVVEINHQPFTVVGVAPQGFFGTTVGVRPDYYVPLMMEPRLLPLENLNYRAPGFLHMIGRLRPGVTVAAANAEAQRLAGELARRYPATNRKIGVAVSAIGGAHYGLQPALGPVLRFLMLAMALVLIIGCANVGSLVLARAAERTRERAVRQALGGGRWRLLRQRAVEYGMLAVLAGGVGWLLADAAGGLLGALLPGAQVPLGLEAGLGPRAALLAALATAAVAAWMTLAPALGPRPELAEALRSGGRGSSAAQQRLRGGLVMVEAMLAFTVLVSATLLGRSLGRAQAANPGFTTRNVLTAALDVRGAGIEGAQAANYYAQLRQRVAALPGVEAASFERWLALASAGNGATRPTVEGYAGGAGEDADIGYNTVGPGYFATLGIGIVSGRGFTAADRAGAPRVCVVNASMARRYWPGENPIGHRLNSWDQWWTVVGIARDSQFGSLREAAQPFLYFPFLQDPSAGAALVVRTAGDPLALAAPLRAAAGALNPQATVIDTQSYAAVLEGSLYAERAAAELGLVLAGLALLLAGMGLYGVLAFSVAQRMREMGLRMALGARPGDVQGAVVRQGVVLVAMGIGLGAVLADYVAQALGGLLYGVPALDPLTWTAAAATLLIIAAAASLVPARRATRADPCAVLRAE